MSTELQHLSYSSISSYLSCAAAWKMHYLDKVTTSTSPELVFGSAFHGTIEDFIAQQANPKRDKAGNVIKPDLIGLWNQKWTEHTTCEEPRAEGESEDKPVQRIPRTDIEWVKDTPEGYCNQGVKMFSHPDIQQGILSIKSSQIETKVELRVPGVPIPIIGYIDVITNDGIPGDFKTSSTSWTADKAVNELQPVFYLAALNQAGIHTHQYRFKHYIFVKTKTPQFQLIEHVHRPGELFWLFGMIAKVWKGIEAGVFPENSGSWKCSPQYCEFWSRCRGKHG